jgi:hypothetical protein
MANENAKKKIKQLEQARSVIEKIIDQSSWASDVGDFPDISAEFDNICEAAENALEQIENELDYLQEQMEEYEVKEAEFQCENEVKV